MSTPHSSGPESKRVGASGQISLGKRYAGRLFQAEHREDGSIVLTPVAMVPESQLWTLQEPDRSRISRALAWAAEHPAQASDVDALVSQAHAGR
jgi:hypothetical protein